MGIQTMLTCIEMVPFSIFFHYAYDVKPYLISSTRPLCPSTMTNPHAQYDDSKPALSPMLRTTDADSDYVTEGLRYQDGFLGYRAWISLFNPMEIIRGMMFAFRMASELRSGNV